MNSTSISCGPFKTCSINIGLEFVLDRSISQFYYTFKFKMNTLNFSYFCHIIELFQLWSSLQQSYQPALIDYMQWAYALRASPYCKLKQREETFVQMINQHETKREKHFLSESHLFILTKQDEPWTWLLTCQPCACTHTACTVLRSTFRADDNVSVCPTYLSKQVQHKQLRSKV